jgi:hypothetical protein
MAGASFDFWAVDLKLQCRDARLRPRGLNGGC